MTLLKNIFGPFKILRSEEEQEVSIEAENVILVSISYIRRRVFNPYPTRKSRVRAVEVVT